MEARSSELDYLESIVDFVLCIGHSQSAGRKNILHDIP